MVVLALSLSLPVLFALLLSSWFLFSNRFVLLLLCFFVCAELIFVPSGRSVPIAFVRVSVASETPMRPTPLSAAQNSQRQFGSKSLSDSKTFLQFQLPNPFENQTKPQSSRKLGSYHLALEKGHSTGPPLCEVSEGTPWNKPNY